MHPSEPGTGLQDTPGRLALSVLLVVTGLAVVYRDVVPELVKAWSTDDN